MYKDLTCEIKEDFDKEGASELESFLVVLEFKSAW